MNIGAIILCGGRSRRMGAEKAWLPFGRETMLGRVSRILGTVTDNLAVVAAPGQKLPPLGANVPVLRDRVPDQGPLEGLRIGLQAMQGRAEAVFACGCDTPLLQPALVQWLFAKLEDYQIVVPCNGAHCQPLVAVYRPSLVPVIDHLLENEKRRPADLFACVPTRHVAIEHLRTVDPDLQSLINVNSPELYQQVLELAGIV